MADETTDADAEPTRERAEERRAGAETPPDTLTPDEARHLLLRLREEVILPRHPSVPRNRGILRKAIVDALLRHLPEDRAEWEAYLPDEALETIAPEHLEFLDEILAIVGRVRVPPPQRRKESGG